MTTEELTMLLVRIQVLDNRQVDQLTIEAWEPIIGHLNYDDALTAVNNHFRETVDYLRPAHIVQGVKRIDDERDREWVRTVQRVKSIASMDDKSLYTWLEIDKPRYEQINELWERVDDRTPAEDQLMMKLLNELRDEARASRDEVEKAREQQRALTETRSTAVTA